MPRYVTAQNRWVLGDELALADVEAAGASTVNGDPFDTSEYSTLDLLLDVTSTGTGTLDVKIQTRTAAGAWADVAAFAQKNSITSERKRFVGLGDECRTVAVVVGASADFDYTLTGIAK